MKIPFSIKYRPQIESGEYKVETRDGHSARIICWDANCYTPIVFLATEHDDLDDKDKEYSYSCNNFGRCFSVDSSNDLFIVTPESTGISEFGMKVSEFAEAYNLAATDYKSKEYKSCNGNLQLIIDKYAAELLSLARKELIEERYISDPRKTDLYKLGVHDGKEEAEKYVLNDPEYLLKAVRLKYPKTFDAFIFEDMSRAANLGKIAALKDFPKWKKWENGACGSESGCPLAIVHQYGGYKIVDALGIQGEKYIMLSDLEKLPGFKEDESHE